MHLLEPDLDTDEADEASSTFPPKKWFVGFVPPIEKEWWQRFLHDDHVHAFAMRPTDDDDGEWLIVEPWWTRLPITVLDYEDARRFLEWAEDGHLLWVPAHSPGSSSQMRGVITCAAFISHMLGRDYQVWTPHQLFERLQSESETKRIDPSAIIDLYDDTRDESVPDPHREERQYAQFGPLRRDAARQPEPRIVSP